jgi:hypothetical protein
LRCVVDADCHVEHIVAVDPPPLRAGARVPGLARIVPFDPNAAPPPGCPLPNTKAWHLLRSDVKKAVDVTDAEHDEMMAYKRARNNYKKNEAASCSPETVAAMRKQMYPTVNVCWRWQMTYHETAAFCCIMLALFSVFVWLCIDAAYDWGPSRCGLRAPCALANAHHPRCCTATTSRRTTPQSQCS